MIFSSLRIKAFTAMSLLSLSAALAQATPVTIPNASFESPSTPTSTTTNDDIIPGWVFQANGKGFSFGTEAISKYFSSIQNSSGDNFAFIENFDTTTKDTITSASSLGAITPDTTYTLTVAVGNVRATDSDLYGSPGNVSLSLLADGVAFATKTITNGTVPNGTWEDFSLTYTTPSAGSIIGENLKIQLASLPQTAWGYEAAFDNVTLNEVPEPSTAALFCAGALMLIWYWRRQRLPVLATSSSRRGAPTYLILLPFLASASLADATPFTVPNGSFETPSSPTQSATDTSLIPGWTFNVNGDGSYFGTLPIASNFNFAGASSGSDAAFINNDYPNVTDTITSSVPLTTIAPLTQYTLTVAIGNVKGSDSSLYNAPGNVSFSLLANGAVIATEQVPNGTVPNGTFEDFSFIYTSPASGTAIGENLTVQLAALPESGAAYKPVFDNVTLDAVSLAPSAVPEPSTFPTLILGLTALGLVLHRKRRPNLKQVAAATVLFMGGIAAATATPVTVPNASFENPTTPTGGDGAPVPGWVFNSPSGNLYGTSAIANSFRSEGAASGNNYAFIINDSTGKTDTITSAASLGLIQPDTIYTLSVAVGNVAGSDSVSNHSPGNVSFSLLANGAAFATDTVSNGTVPDGTFEDFSLTFQTPGAGGIIGENLEIQLASLPTGSLGYGPAFDNVTLDATSVAVAPEPPTWALLFAGGLSLAWLMRRSGQNGALPAVVTTARK